MILPNDRVANVKTIAARIAKNGEGSSIREFLDASALAAGAMLRACYRGPGLEVAVRRYCDALMRAVQKDTP